MELPGARPVTRATARRRRRMISTASRPKERSAGQVPHPRRLRRRHFAHHSLRREICPLHQHGHGAAAPDGGNLWAYCTSTGSSTCRRPCIFRTNRSTRGLRSSDTSGVSTTHRPRVDFSGRPHSVSGQLRSDAGLDRSRQRHAGWPGRRQRPHVGREYERRHLVGRRDAQRRRSARARIGEKTGVRCQGSAVRLARTPRSFLTPDP